MMDPVKCERDWQGPCDDDCMDDLLTVHCVRRILRPPHLHHWHCGIVEDETDAGFRVVWWLKGTEDLYDYKTNDVYRRQFADA